MPIKHLKTNQIANWTQADLDAQIALGQFPPGTLLADIVLPSDWNDDHTSPDIADVTGLQAALDAKQGDLTLTTVGTSGAATLIGDTLNIPNYADTDTGITQLTGDVTAGPGNGSQVATLATVNANVGSFGSATQVMTQTVNAKGLTTAAGNVSIAIPSTQVTDFTEAAQDAVGAMVNTSLTYVDAMPSLGLTPRTINGTTFDGTGNITVTAAAGTLTGGTLAAGVTASSLTSVGTIATGVWQGTPVADAYIASAATWNAKQNAITFGTGVQTALGVNIGSAGAPVLFNGALGTPSSGVATNLTGTAAALNIGGNAATATTLATGRTIAITGDLAYTSPAFDGSGNVTAAGTLATVNANVGSFGSATQVGTFTVNAKGLTTAAGNVTITPAVGSITGLGTGIATALAVNVGTAGAPVINGGALGTPSSGVATNLTGTAAGLTAGTVTTNANLTGAVTSVGNATSLGSFSSANLRTALTDENGTGAALFDSNTAATLNQPNIVGVTTNSNASAGSVGEYIESTVAFGSAVALTTATGANVTSISLTAGDWDVEGVIGYTSAATTVFQQRTASISVNSAIPGASGQLGYTVWANGNEVPGGFANYQPTGRKRLSLSATTTVYLVAFAQFTTAASSAFGQIGARRIR